MKLQLDRSTYLVVLSVTALLVVIGTYSVRYAKKDERLKEGLKYYNAGNYYYAQENYKQAISYYDEAIQRSADIPAVGITYMMRGACHEMLGEIALAESDYDESVVRWNETPTTLKNRAGFYMRQQRWREAIDDLTEVIESPGMDVDPPTRRECYQMRGESYQGLGENSKASSDLSRAP